MLSSLKPFNSPFHIFLKVICLYYKYFFCISSPVVQKSGRLPFAVGIVHNVPQLFDVLWLNSKFYLFGFLNLKSIKHMLFQFYKNKIWRSASSTGRSPSDHRERSEIIAVSCSVPRLNQAAMDGRLISYSGISI